MTGRGHHYLRQWRQREEESEWAAIAVGLKEKQHEKRCDLGPFVRSPLPLFVVAARCCRPVASVRSPLPLFIVAARCCRPVAFDESFDVSRKEKIAIVFRYIDKKGFVMERLIDIGHVQDTSASSLKEAIVNLLAQHSLSPSSVRGQCYDGASNMEVFCNIIDWQLQELSDRFNEVTTDLLHGIACLNPINSFSSFDIKKVMRMAKLYPDDFDESNMSVLENQLASYVVNVRDIDERFSDLNGLYDLSKRLIQTKKHSTYPLVFLLVKLALLLPVATAFVERAFLTMKFIKNDLRSQMSDDFFSGCLFPYLEKDVFDSISNDAIIKTFQDMKPRRIQL
ncbi:uncharacterized protein LOC129890544 [Solanum dulcamara]|uniref:uncharacterized protein LOC129890544 n=1 Tax=Solanum dulcamara TaxID=45834 RepID=UPI002484FF41|nr:uncharacterized protein LOC129890544 [Solanum dulcamara]